MRVRGVGEVFIAFLKLGVTSFGGPVAHLGFFREELVAKRKWVSEQQYAELVALCQFLPGPASSQVGFVLGMVRAGYRGAIAAWLAFTLPSALLMVLFALGAVVVGGPAGQGLFAGLKAVAVAVVAHAVWGMARTLTPDIRRMLIAVVGAAAALLVPGSLGQVIAVAAGFVAGISFCRSVVTLSSQQDQPIPVRTSRRTATVLLAAFAALLVVLPLVARVLHDSWVSITDAFYRAGALVFGGGHVVLPLLQAESAIAEAVTPEQFLAGYGAAQAVPGPLFTFAAYLGFEMETGAEAWLSALLALVAVFLPGLLLVTGVLPFWNAVRRNRFVRAAVVGANAAVVGILAAALVTPVITSGITGITPLIIAVGCLFVISIWKLPAWVAVLIGAAAGLLAGLWGLGLSW